MNEKTSNFGKLAELEPGKMREVKVSGNKVLLLRQDDEVFAVDAECPHAGGPLGEGVFLDGNVICPWHKAKFCIRTGKDVEPPAVDDLHCYKVKIVKGDILVEHREQEAEKTHPGLDDKRHFVVLGAGAAGYSAVQALRETGFSGKITLVSQEKALPYDRTILSKYVLAGQEASEKSPLQDDAFYKTQKIERCVAEIKGLDPKRKRVELSGGKHLSYDAALIATGSNVIAPPFPGGSLKNVFTLRSQDDAGRIVDAAGKAKRAVVIGASFIGMEAAAALRERGLEVTVVGGENAPFERQLGADVGNVFRKVHEEKGVIFRLGAEVEWLEGEHEVAAVLLAGGERISADIVIAGIGVRPATGFIKALASGKDHGLEVDAQLKLAEDLYVAGDVAAFPNFGNGPRIRVEHWRVAEQQGRIAALNMLGSHERFAKTPYFWTAQFGMQLDYVGHAKGDDVVVVRGDLEKQKFIVYYLQGGVVAAAAGMNHEQDMAALIELLGQRQDWTVDALHPVGSSPELVLKDASPV